MAHSRFTNLEDGGSHSLSRIFKINILNIDMIGVKNFRRGGGLSLGRNHIRWIGNQI
ncbi:hypothetical protein SAMN05444166_3922 [Singulisphaera sp. GP187]|nr:hypothetical protein SAMN05444166_3922 [Singulisphaera sp. GP187]